MKAIVQNNYGSPDVLELKEVDKPEIKDDGVLIRVQAASIAAGDYFTMKGEPYVARFFAGWPKPKDYITGGDAAGIVESVGPNVTQFKPGDEVFGECGGACAEFSSAAEDKFAHKPANLDFQQAAAVPTSAVTALLGLRDAGKVQAGQKVLINGASGGVGTFAVQIAKALGADVTGVCSTGKVETVRSLGADHVIDYTQENFTEGGPRYDLILDNVANHSLADCRRALNPHGLHIPNSGNSGLGYIIKASFAAMFLSQQGSPLVSNTKQADLIVLKEMIEAGNVTPVIDKIYPLAETREAFTYASQGHAQGKVVITM